MIGEYERLVNVTIKHSCGCSENHLLNRQPGFGQILVELKARPCSKCRQEGVASEKED